MLYYKIEAISEKVLQPRRRTDEEFFKKDICSDAVNANEKLAKMNSEIVIVEIRKETIVAILITKQIRKKDIERAVSLFFQEMKIEINSFNFKEITIEHASDGIKLGAENGFLSDESEVLEKYGIEDFDCTETVVSEPSDIKEKIKMNSAFLCFSGVDEELKRIASTSKKRFYGHPVHYVVMSDDKEQSRLLINFLITKLYKANRVSSRRICTEEFEDSFRGLMPNVYELCKTYRAQKGATIVLKPKDVSEFGMFLGSNYEFIQIMCDVIKKYQCETLSIIELDRDAGTTLRSIRKELGDVRLVVFKEQLLSYDNAVKYLTNKAKEKNLRNVCSVFKALSKTGNGFYPEELNKHFSRWYSQYICTRVYPQYSEIEHYSENVCVEIKGSAHDKLMKMVGLNEAKKVLSEIIAYHTAQKYYKDFGLEMDRTSNHMVFTGNPGSAKTTVARLFAKILKDNGVLQKGVFIEAGRSEIVDKYLGGTAPRVKELFTKAEGGILFIDEAYSLVDGQRGLYGDEAINTIVQEMENNRNKVIVIFAGYPDKMNQFLDNNPGLRSRIAFQVTFDDYNTDELVDILRLLAEDKKMALAPGVIEKVRPFFEVARTHKEYGNGRYVRNVFEKAVMHQAGRLIKYQRSELNTTMVSTLIADDFEVPDEYAAKQARRIGFSI